MEEEEDNNNEEEAEEEKKEEDDNDNNNDEEFGSHHPAHFNTTQSIPWVRCASGNVWNILLGLNSVRLSSLVLPITPAHFIFNINPKCK